MKRVALATAGVLTLGLATFASGPAVAAQPHGMAPAGWLKAHQTGELTASDGASYDHFGASVAVSANGKVAVVGANAAGYGLGAVYVYLRRHGTWAQVQELSEPKEGGAGAENFGSAVAVSADGSTVVVGADSQGAGTWVGAAYVFSRDGMQWNESAELTASDASDMSFFGFSLAVSSDGDTVLVGAYGHASNTGAAYVFARGSGSWTQVSELTAEDGAQDDLFGYSVALSGDGSTAVVGADYHDSDRGAAYVFQAPGGEWTPAAELTGNSEFFGTAVAASFDGSSVAVGGLGSVDLFNGSEGQWTLEEEIDGVAGDDYGFAVSLSSDGSILAVGAYRYNETTGAAYVYRHGRKGWKQKAMLTASDGQPYAAFGSPLAVSGNGATVVVGAQDQSDSAGAAYVFRK